MSFLARPRHAASLKDHPLSKLSISGYATSLAQPACRRWRQCFSAQKSWLALNPTLCRRWAHDAAAARKPAYAIPELLNVYRAGSGPTLTVGFTRILTIGVFAVGVAIYGPAVYFSPETSNLWLPAVVIFSAVPMTFTALATGPMIHSIELWVPTWARYSKQELKRFVSSKIPSDTMLRLRYMRFAPWPTVRDVRFADLQRVRPSWSAGISNLEYVPDHAKAYKGTLSYWMVQGYFGRYYVSRDQGRDRSAAPGAWNELWNQIPQVGASNSGSPSSKVFITSEHSRIATQKPKTPSRPTRAAADVPKPPPPPPPPRLIKSVQKKAAR